MECSGLRLESSKPLLFPSCPGRDPSPVPGAPSPIPKPALGQFQAWGSHRDLGLLSQTLSEEFPPNISSQSLSG